MVGQIVSHYEILEKLGEGGMGVVYKAKDTRLDRLVALKFLPPHLLASGENASRFAMEGRAAAALNHPNICTIFAYEESEGAQFIAMEYLDGVTLKSLIAEPGAAGRPGRRHAMELGIQIAEAIREAHQGGIIHRDIKPENVMINRRGQAKVMDFGLARLKGTERLTQASSTVGTIAYMAPEIFQGAGADTGSDIFSFGVLLYELLSGRRPFRGEHEAAIIYSILNEEPAPLDGPGGFPPALAQVFARLLHKDPALRYHSMADVIDDLRRIDLDRLPPGHAIQAVPLPAPQPRATKSLAVLPFENISPEREHEYFSDGLTEEIIADLSKVGGLAVVSRTTAMRYRGSDKPLRAIADELGVEFILEGTVRKQLNNLRITAKLIRADQDVQLWAETYRGTIDDVFEIQERVAAQIADALRVQLTPAEQLVLRKRHTRDPEAYQLYLQGRFWWNKRTEEGFRKAIQFFEQAIGQDATYAVAHAGLADCYNLLCAYALVPPDDAAPKARAASTAALQLDPELAEAHEADAHVGMLFDWNRTDVEHRFKRAIALNPLYATAYQRLAIYLAAAGRSGEALALIQQARALDPLSLIINADEAFLLMMAGMHEPAIERCLKTVELDPGFWVARFITGLAYEQSGEFEKAIAEFQQAGAPAAWNVILLSALGHAMGMAGRADEALKILGLLEERAARTFVPSYARAVVHAGTGNAGSALEALGRAIDERSVWLVHIHLATDPRLQSLHGHPGFRELTARTLVAGRRT